MSGDRVCRCPHPHHPDATWCYVCDGRILTISLDLLADYRARLAELVARDNNPPIRGG